MDSTIKQSYIALSELLYDVNKTVYFFRNNNFDKALRFSKTMIDRMSGLLEGVMSGQTYLSTYILENQQNMQMMFENIMYAQESGDYILLADLYELQLADWLKKVQAMITSQEECSLGENGLQTNLDLLKDASLKAALKKCKKNDLEEAGYKLEFTSTGEPTLYKATAQSGFYFHSNVSPKWDGFLLSQSWYREEIEHYSVYGLGLGYAIHALLEKNPFIQVTVWESDLLIIYAALLSNDFNAYLEEDRLHIIYDPAWQNVSDEMKKGSKDFSFVIHYPSMQNIGDMAIRERVENYFIQYHSIQNQRVLLDGNFKRNILHNHRSAEYVGNQIRGKKAYIVAAGPSLDRNFMHLKKVKDGIIIATGTVLKKLLKAQIYPDFVVVTDANPRVYSQIRGVEESSIPMIYLSTAHYRFAKEYKGDRYIACQYGHDGAESYAKEKGYMLFETGGSVTTAAMDICVRLGCSEVIFLGLDLAYPNGHAHAADTSRRDIADTRGLRDIEDIHGAQVKTSKILSMYKKWIEGYIRKNPHVRFVDATEGGARIEGTITKQLTELL